MLHRRLPAIALLTLLIPIATRARDAAPPAAAGWTAVEAAITEKQFDAAFAAYEIEADGGLLSLRERQADRRMSLGSTGMVFVHGAVSALVKEGAARWDTELFFDPALVSVPASRTEQGLAPGFPMPLHEWSRLMLVESDNTAAEHLMALLGRERIELWQGEVRARAVARGDGGLTAPVVTPHPVEPFLTPLEFHKLKVGPLAELTECYAWSGDAERREIVASHLPFVDVSSQLLGNWNKPRFLLQIGWFASPAELGTAASMLARAAGDAEAAPALDALRQEQAERRQGPGGAWRRIWSKLGGEVGAVSGIWILERRDGRRFALALIINDDRAPINLDRTIPVITAAMTALASTP